MFPAMSPGLRQLATSAISACNSMTSVQSADTLTYIMSSVITAHYNTCLYTSEKVVVGKFKYDTLMRGKPPVLLPLSVSLSVCLWGYMHPGKGVCSIVRRFDSPKVSCIG